MVHAARRRQLAVAQPRDRTVLVVFGAISVGVFYVALPAAIDAGGVSLATILLYTAPVWVALLAWPLLRERPTTRTAVLVAVTAAGVVLVSGAGRVGVRVGPAAPWWGLLCGVLYATWFLVGRGLSGRVAPVTIAAWTLPVGALVLAPLVPFAAESVRDWLLIVGLGLTSTYAPTLAYYTGVGRIPAARAAVIATVEPVAALALAAAFLDERLTLVALFGAALIIAAALAAATSTATPRRS